jgi:hypothetical protein
MKRRLLMASAALLSGVLTNGCSTPSAMANNNENSLTIVRSETAANCQNQIGDQNGLLIVDSSVWMKVIATLDSLNVNPSSWKPNFSQNTAALVKVGAKPTAGFGLIVLGAVRGRDSTELVVRIKETKPANGTLSPTVVTSPCALIEVAGTGFQSVRLVREN